MVPKIHAKGSSFKGCAEYILHDKDAQTNERVVWIETRNLATNNPDAAWRVMAATAIDQDRLKQEAGIPNTGRKSNKSVLHFTLSWHEEEAEHLTPEEQRAAVNAMLRVMGAQDHQTLIVSHNDEPQPHVHVMVNRVHPEDGRMLSSSFEKLKASKWAQAYEEERGKIYCHERVINNAARERGEYVRAKKDEARHYHDKFEAAANDNAKIELIEKDKKEIGKFFQAKRELSRRHHVQRVDLERSHHERVKNLANERDQALARGRDEVREQFRPRWEEAHHQQQAELAAFEKREQEFMGRIHNAFGLIDFGSLMGKKEHDADGRAATLREIFKLGDAGARLQILKRQQDQREKDLFRDQKTAEAKVAGQVKKNHLDKENQAFRKLERDRNDLSLRQNLEGARLKAQWQEHDRRRRQEWKIEDPANKVKPTDDARRTQTPKPDGEGGKPLNTPSRDIRTSQTNPGDLLPQKNADIRAQQIDRIQQLKEARQQREQSPGQDKDRGDDRGR